MKCIRCCKAIADDALYCCYCGIKQTQPHRRSNGTGTINIDRRYRNQYIAHAPADRHGKGRIYLGSFPDLANAQKALDEYIKNGRPDLSRATVEKVYEMWSQTHFRNISAKTAESYRSVWKHFASVAGMKMADIRTVHFQNIVNSHYGNGVSREIKVLARYLCRFAMENDIIDKNYADFITLPKTEKNEKIIFTSDQLAMLWKHSDDRNVQTILVMIYMGFRIGEITSLTAEMVHIDEGYIQSGIKTDAGKDRIIPFPENIPEIRDFVSYMVKYAAPDGRLFSMTEHTFRRKVFYATLIKHGLIDAVYDCSGAVKFHTARHLTPHSTRHTFATLSVAAGMQPERLQKIIGHASYRTTVDYYVHTDRAALASEMRKLWKCV